MASRAASCTSCELHAESTFKVEGMDCREEVALLERRFKHLPGLEDFSADLMGQRLLVKYDASFLPREELLDALRAAVQSVELDAGPEGMIRAPLSNEALFAAGTLDT